MTSDAWVVTAGTHTVRACADWWNFVPESNENNNCMNYVFTVSASTTSSTTTTTIKPSTTTTASTSTTSSTTTTTIKPSSTTTTTISDTTPPVSQIISPTPASGSTQNANFNVYVSDSDVGSGLATCNYAVTDYNNGFTVLKTSRPCNGPILITVGPNDNCRTEGTNKCTVRVDSTDNAGNLASLASRTFSISYSSTPS